MMSVASSARPSISPRTPASTTSPMKTEWSPFSTVSTSLHSTKAGALARTGAPVAPAANASPPMLSPSRSSDLKKVNAWPCCPLPRTFRAKLPDSLMMSCAPESALTPTTTKGGAKDAWVTQFTVAAATRPSLASLVKMYSPYGIMRSAVFLASASIRSSSILVETPAPPPCGHGP